jgi:ribonucleoside-diphosphate reductase alpha chain
MEGIAEWYRQEMLIFKSGSGAGVNISKLRGAGEPLSKGGVSSGGVTFMRAADASAGTIQSGGRTRRAAKMVVCDVDYPDIEDFIWCKAREEERIRILAQAGVPIGLGAGEEGERNLAEATAYQNANNSVRVSDEFMRAVENDEDWQLIARTDGSVVKTVKARELMRQIAEAAWQCADPGVQYDTTINDWHTTPAQGRISASNPCSEYLSNDNSACNLASLNLMKFLRADGTFDVESYRHVTRVMFTAQDITISFSHFPTEQIANNSRNLRQIGIGYANLGALLMALGLPYDSDEGRDMAAAVTAMLTGEAYLQSTRLAERLGPFNYYRSVTVDERGREVSNEKAMLRVLRKHRAAAQKLTCADPELTRAAKSAWSEVVKRAQQHGVRNAQASVLAPTGTIAFMMDCDTTGIEPDFALVKNKVMAGGGFMTIVNKTLPVALRKLGYSSEQIADMVAYAEEHGNLVGAPHLADEHLPVFDVAVGERAISPMGHIKMMAAVQPFLSGAISKTVNLPSHTTVEEIEQIYMEGWKLGLKAIAIYRDGCKHAQPLSDAKATKTEESEAEIAADLERLREQVIEELRAKNMLRGQRQRVPEDGIAKTHHFRIGQMSGYLTVGLDEEGKPINVMINTSQAGSALANMIRSWAQLLSYALQFGVPLDFLVSKLAFTSFEPNGFTGPNAPVRTAHSLIDYVVRYLAAEHLDPSTHETLGIVRSGQNGAADVETEADLDRESGEVTKRVEVHSETIPTPPAKPMKITASGEGACSICGGTLVRTGACKTCSNCGTNLGGCG